MRNVKWVTLIYIASALIPLIIGGTMGIATIRGDIKDIRGDVQKSREIAHQENVNTNHKIDSLNHESQYQFRDIWAAIANLDSIRTVKTRTVYVKPGFRNVGYYTHQVINGKDIWTKVR
jgi:hypothetical protein